MMASQFADAPPSLYGYPPAAYGAQGQHPGYVDPAMAQAQQSKALDAPPAAWGLRTETDHFQPPAVAAANYYLQQQQQQQAAAAAAAEQQRASYEAQRRSFEAQQQRGSFEGGRASSDGRYSMDSSSGHQQQEPRSHRPSVGSRGGRRDDSFRGGSNSTASNEASLRIINSIAATGEITWDLERDTPVDLQQLFSALSEHGYVSEALGLLRDLVAHGRRDVLSMLRHKPFLTAACDKRMVDEALAFLDIMPPEFVDNRTYNMVLSVCVAGKSLQGGFRVMGQLRERGIRPDLILYTNMLTIAARCGDADKAFQLFRQMKEEGVRPCAKAYTAVISACSQEIMQSGSVKNRRRQLVLLERAFSVLEEMRQAQIEPDLAVYNVILSACGRAGEIQRLRDVYRAMESRGYAPDVATYGTLVSVLAKNGRPEEALETYQRALMEGKANSVRLFGAAIEACADLGTRGAVLAREVWEEMHRQGLRPDAQLFGALIRVAGRAGDVEHAFEAFDDMRNSGLEPTREIRSILIQACVQGGQVQRGFEILDELARTHAHSAAQDSQGPPLLIDGANALVSAYARQGNLERVYEVVSRALKLGLRPDEVTYSGLFNCCLEVSREPRPLPPCLAPSEPSLCLADQGGRPGGGPVPDDAAARGQDGRGGGPGRAQVRPAAVPAPPGGPQGGGLGGAQGPDWRGHPPAAGRGGVAPRALGLARLCLPRLPGVGPVGHPADHPHAQPRGRLPPYPRACLHPLQGRVVGRLLDPEG